MIGIIARLWPNTKYVDTIVTGNMSQYMPTLDYYGNGIPLVSETEIPDIFKVKRYSTSTI